MNEKIKKKYDFSNKVFDHARLKRDYVFQQMSKPMAAAIEQTLYTCYRCGGKDILSIAKQVRSCDEGTSVFNKCNHCHNKWID